MSLVLVGRLKKNTQQSNLSVVCSIKERGDTLMELKEVKLHLVDTNRELCVEFQNHFRDYSNVEVWNRPFQELPEFDVMVSPANSYGQMTGGIDKYIIDFFGQQLMDRVQEYIIRNYAGEQPVGTSFIIETGNANHPYLVHTPTMSIPKSIEGTDNPYRAMKAMLLAVQNHNRSEEKKIKSIACSGLGTMVGKVPPRIAANQMALAYKHVLNPIQKIDWFVAMDHEKEIDQSKE